MTTVPDPNQPHPTTRPDLSNVVFLKPTVNAPFIEAGDYTYYDNDNDPAPFEETTFFTSTGHNGSSLGGSRRSAPGRRS